MDISQIGAEESWVLCSDTAQMSTYFVVLPSWGTELPCYHLAAAMVLQGCTECPAHLPAD